MKPFILFAAAGIAMAPAAAFAVVTPFATFTAQNNSYDMAFSNSSNTLYTTGSATQNSIGSPSSVLVNFSLLNGAGSTSQTIGAVFTLSSVSTGAASQDGSTGTVSQGGFTGAAPTSASPGFSFLSTGSFSYNGTTYGAGTNLLSAGFTNATLSAEAGSSAASFRDSTPGGAGIVRTVDYTSTIFDFSKSTDRSFSLSLDALAPPAQIANGKFASFSASAAGTFSSDNVSSAVPEAGTWLMMVAGFAITGFGMRRKSKATSLVDALP